MYVCGCIYSSKVDSGPQIFEKLFFQLYLLSVADNKKLFIFHFAGDVWTGDWTVYNSIKL